MKEVIVNYDDIYLPILREVDKPGHVCLAIRNGDQYIHIGDWLGGSQIIGLEAYGKELDYFSPGLTGMMKLDKMPIFTIQESLSKGK